MDCVFCKIVSNEISADKIYEDEKVLAFMDIRPVSRGHALVIPKKHTDDIMQTDDATAAELIHKSKQIADAIVKAVSADGFSISTNNGEAAGQTVFHVHFHIIPRSAGVDFKFHAREMEKPEKLRALADKIKAALH